MKALKSIVKVYNKAEEIALVAMIAISVILLFINVILRYCFNSSIYGADEIARIFFIWMSWLGISLGQRRNEHIRIDILANALHGVPKKVILILADVITLIILGALVVFGIQVTLKFYGNHLSTPMWKFPKYFLFASVPFSCFVMALRILVNIHDVILFKEETSGEEAQEL